jgi:NaMN:DMB phosphoribosyltransferase
VRAAGAGVVGIVSVGVVPNPPDTATPVAEAAVLPDAVDALDGVFDEGLGLPPEVHAVSITAGARSTANKRRIVDTVPRSGGLADTTHRAWPAQRVTDATRSDARVFAGDGHQLPRISRMRG